MTFSHLKPGDHVLVATKVKGELINGNVMPVIRLSPQLVIVAGRYRDLKFRKSDGKGYGNSFYLSIDFQGYQERLEKRESDLNVLLSNLRKEARCLLERCRDTAAIHRAIRELKQ